MDVGVVAVIAIHSLKSPAKPPAQPAVSTEMSTKPLPKHYSGPLSVTFWRRVNRLPEPDGTTVYLLGCALQDLEGRALQLLRHSEQKAPKRARKATP